ncbi:hypothetical protein CI109_101459 [Kwoniella shandongensis]|uniref:Uncharacterized protein n=1 Tax=Kwoniella shandongensis TaxID=1734106 RepID=A0A5M6C039_9TREE|nr:uncharacterized protein CI109_005155 [Kwoniella shandongensis]KAA5526579.1 hypothetical protein CI109_005155 [Kwoniella shandongensis]
MSTLPSPAPAPARRQLTVPSQPNQRSTSPASPHHTSPVRNVNGNGVEAGPSRTNRGSTAAARLPNGNPREIPHIPIRKRSLPLAAPSTHPLQMEIDRLTAVCEEHERVIRSGLSTVKHHLLTMTPDIMERFHQYDDDAETVTASIQQSLQDQIPPFQAHLRQIIENRERDVDVMRRRTTPWKDVVSTEDKDIVGPNGKIGGQEEGSLRKLIKSMEGSDEGSDALNRVELWTDEIEMYLNGEIVRVKERIASRKYQQAFTIRAVATIAVLAVVFTSALYLYWYYPERIRFLRFLRRFWPF